MLQSPVLSITESVGLIRLRMYVNVRLKKIGIHAINSFPLLNDGWSVA